MAGVLLPLGRAGLAVLLVAMMLPVLLQGSEYTSFLWHSAGATDDQLAHEHTHK